MTGPEAPIRYLRLRADTLMGLFRNLPEPARAQALQALVRSTAEHGGDSARRYLESACGDSAALLAMLVRIAGELGWGQWRFVESTTTRLVLEVTDSPFAAGFGPADVEVCAPITGMVQAAAQLVLRQECEAREVSCCARGADTCRFEAVAKR